MTRSPGLGGLVFAVLAVAALQATPLQERDQRKGPPSVDAVLKAYAGGDLDAISRSFTKSTDFADGLELGKPDKFEKWLGKWDRTKAVFVIEMANVAVTRAPAFMAAFTRAGRKYLLDAQENQKTAAEVATIDVAWHRIAVALLMRLGNPLLVEEHIDALAMATKDSERSLEPRLVLARAVARETICWESRPTHEHPGQDLEALTSATGVRIEADLDGPRRAVLRKKFETHRACLKDAATRFAAAEVAEDTRAEALTRGAFVLFLDGRAREASEKLAAVRPGNDRFLAYWTALFQGRVLGALGRAEQALQAYGRALDLYPGAQSASIGRAIELSHLRRSDEVDAVSQRVRATSAEDPWLTYFKAEQRFIDQWLKDLRAVLR